MDSCDCVRYNKKMWIFLKLSMALIFILAVFHTDIYADSGSISILRLRDRRVIGFDEMIKEIRDIKLIFIGEYHDSEPHHRMQLDIIKELNSSNLSVAVGVEMFAARSQNYLDLWVRGDIEINDFIKAYYQNWSVPWTFYNDILLYIRDNKIPAIGLNLSKGLLEKIKSGGVSSLNKKELGELPGQASCDVDRRYMEFIERVYAFHGHKERYVDNFCESLIMKDRAMAQRIARYVKENPDKRMVVLTGVNHAWKRGIPEKSSALLKRLRYTVILLGVSGFTDARNFTTEDADFIFGSNGSVN